MSKLPIALLIPLVVAGCVRPPAPPPQPRPVPPPPRAAPPPAAPVANWADRAPAAGSWTYATEAGGSVAMFGPAGSAPLFTLRCDRNGSRIVASRIGNSAARMTLTSTTGARGYDAVPSGGQTLYVSAQIAARDPQLDSMAFSRGRILIGLDGAPDLIMPIWPEFTRVIEDCRG